MGGLLLGALRIALRTAVLLALPCVGSRVMGLHVCRVCEVHCTDTAVVPGLGATPAEEEEEELYNKNPPTPCLWKAPASTQKTKRKLSYVSGGGRAGG